VCFQTKEKKNPVQNAPVTSSEPVSGYKSPPSTLPAASLTSATAAVKSTAGKFTTANFIETTIEPSPANLGFGGDAVTTAAAAVLSTSSTSTAAVSSVASVTVSSESLARSTTTSSYALKVATTVSTVSPGSSGITAAKSSTVTTATATSSVATFSNTFQNFVGQNYIAQLDAASSELPTLSSPELPRGKKRQAK